MAKVVLKEKPSDTLRRILGEYVPVDQLQLFPDLINAMAEGMPAPTWNDLIARKVVQLAADPVKTNQWAIEMIMDRVEGKPSTAEASDDGGRAIEEKLDDITQRHLNDLAAQFVEARGASASIAGIKPEAKPPGPASKLMDLPSDRADRAEGP